VFFIIRPARHFNARHAGNRVWAFSERRGVLVMVASVVLFEVNRQVAKPAKA
jgi:hypothetical protein